MIQPRARRWSLLGVGALMAGTLVAVVAAETRTGSSDAEVQPTPALWQPNGPAYALAASGSTVFVGGRFTQVAPHTGPLVALSRATGRRTRFPRIDGGAVADVIPDGDGGWLVGGEFLSVDGRPCKYLARIAADLSVDRRLCGSPNGPVQALQLARRRLFVGGSFDRVAGTRRTALAALDVRTGDLLGWKTILAEKSYGGPHVTDLALRGRTLFVLGMFTSVAGLRRIDLAALDADTARVLPWDPAAERYEDTHDGSLPTVERLAVGRGSVFVSGRFTRLGGTSRRHLAALDVRSGQALPWVAAGLARGPASLAPGGAPEALHVAGGRVYVGGRFGRKRDAPRHAIAAFDEKTGALLPWAPRWAADSSEAIVRIADAVYAVGTVGSSTDPYRVVRAFDVRTGRVLPWRGDAPDGSVEAAAASSSTLVLGGQFSGAGGVVRKNLLALDLRTGRPTPWRAPLSWEDPSGVAALAAGDGALVVERESGIEPPPLAVLATTGSARTRTIDGESPLLVDGETIYVGDGHRLTAIDVATGASRFAVYLGGEAEAIAVNGARLYVAATNGEQDLDLARHRIVEVDLRTEQTTAWEPTIDAETGSGEISALAVSAGRLYVSGQFDHVAGETRDGLASFDLGSRALTSWSPNLGGNGGYVNAMTLAGSNVFVGGFETLAAFDRTTGRRVPVRLEGTSVLRQDVHQLLLVDDIVYAGTDHGVHRLMPQPGS